MRGRLFPILIGLLMGLGLDNVRGDSTWVYSVQVSATVQASPAKITLNWQPDQYGANSYTVSRKNAADSSWGAGVTLAGTASSYVDSSVAIGATYEYRIVKAATVGYTGYGYIYAGINAPMPDSRGKVRLLLHDLLHLVPRGGKGDLRFSWVILPASDDALPVGMWSVDAKGTWHAIVRIVR